MLNALLYEKDILNCKKIINFITSKVKHEIKICCISTNLFEINNLIKEFKIDTIIIDIFNDNNVEIELLYSIFNNNINKKFIVLTSNKDILKLNPEEKILFLRDINLLYDNWHHLIANHSIEANIIKELKYLCFNFNHIGTLYLIDVLKIIYSNHILMNNLSKFVYPTISKNYAVYINTVKCDIFQSTLYSYINCEESKLQKYLGISCIEKPYPKKYIMAIIKHIKLGTPFI